MLTEGRHRGIKVRVLQRNGTPFPEHQLERTPRRSGQPPTTTCWLEIGQGKTFTIEIRLRKSILKRYHKGHWGIETKIDGLIIDNGIDDKTDLVARVYNISEMAYNENGRFLTGRLTFSKLRPTESAISATRYIATGDDSSIQVEVEAVITGKPMHRKFLEKYAASSSPGGVVQEKEAKLIGSTVSVSDAKPAADDTMYKWKSLDSQTPYHRFIFKYRTRPVLEILRIMKPVHTPSHLSAALSAPFEKRKRSTETEGADGQVDVQKQLLEVMSDMPREMNGMRRTIKDLKQERAKKGRPTVDLTAGDSD